MLSEAHDYVIESGGRSNRTGRGGGRAVALRVRMESSQFGSSTLLRPKPPIPEPAFRLPRRWRHSEGITTSTPGLVLPCARKLRKWTGMVRLSLVTSMRPSPDAKRSTSRQGFNEAAIT
jgi:hypothetical protein